MERQSNGMPHAPQQREHVRTLAAHARRSTQCKGASDRAPLGFARREGCLVQERFSSDLLTHSVMAPCECQNVHASGARDHPMTHRRGFVRAPRKLHRRCTASSQRLSRPRWSSRPGYNVRAEAFGAGIHSSPVRIVGHAPETRFRSRTEPPKSDINKSVQALVETPSNAMKTAETYHSQQINVRHVAFEKSKEGAVLRTALSVVGTSAAPSVDVKKPQNQQR